MTQEQFIAMKSNFDQMQIYLKAFGISAITAEVNPGIIQDFERLYSLAEQLKIKVESSDPGAV